MRSFAINPILKKELRVNARTIRFPMALMLYALAMAGAAGILLMLGNTIGIPYSYFTGAFPVLVFIQMGMICMIMPVLTASGISGEREKQTLDIMLTTPMPAFSIVAGKLMASLSQLMFFIICSLPAMAVCFIYGGMNWTYLLTFFLQTLLLALFVGSIGIMCSACYRKTIVSIIITMLLEFVWFAGPPLIVTLIYALKWRSAYLYNAGNLTSAVSMGWIPGIVLLDPMVSFINAIVNRCYASNWVMNILTGAGGSMHTASGLKKLTTVWNYITPVITILLSVLFLSRAAAELDHTRKKNSKQVMRAEQANRPEMPKQGRRKRSRGPKDPEES